MSYKKEWKIDLFLKSNEVMETINLLDLKNFSNLGKSKKKSYENQRKTFLNHSFTVSYKI